MNYSPGEGVDRKILSLAAAARRAGLPMEFYIMNWAGPKQHLPWLHLRPKLPHARRWGLVRVLGENWRRMRELAALVHTGYRIILRFPKVPVNHVLAILRFGRRIITEHHTNEVAELLVRRTAKRRVLAFFVGWLSRLLLHRVAAHIAVTDEVREAEQRKSGRTRALTVTNGIDVSETTFTGFLPFGGIDLHLVFVAADFQPWHGADRLLEGLELYRGPVRIVVSLVGRADNALRSLAQGVERKTPHRILFRGLLRGTELDQAYRGANLAVGSLALHRNGMRQACPLKVREYVARGVPFVYAYEDPDIPSDAAFALRLPPSDAPVDMGLVVDFARKVSGIPGLSAAMRRFALERLDWSIKVRQMYEFACSA